MKLLLLLVAGYAVLALTARWAANQALYHPDLAGREPPPGTIRIAGAEGGVVAARHLPNPDAHFTVWLFHGNAESLANLEPLLQEFHRAGFAVFAFDYPGYTISTGRPSEASLYAASRIARTYLRSTLGVSPERTLLVGRSLGGGPAVQMATEEAVGGLVLQSTFTSVYRVLTQRRLLPFDLYENERKLRQVTAPVLIVHGTHDEIIPWSHGQALHAAAGPRKRHLWVEGAGHNDLLWAAGRQWWETLREFSAWCATESAASAR